MKSIIIYILIVINIPILIINILKLRKYVVYSNISYSDNDSIKLNKYELVYHTISFQLLIIFLLVNYIHPLDLKYDKVIIYFIIITNLIIAIIHRENVKDFSTCISVILNIPPLLIILYCCYKTKLDDIYTIIILITLIVPSLMISIVDIPNINKLLSPQEGTNPKNPVKSKCPFSF